MKMFIITAVLSITFLFSCSKSSHQAEEKAAAEVAIKWLTLVDSARYQQSWEEAAEIFQNAVSSDGWQKQLEQVRRPLGQLNSREVKSTQYATSLPGAPDGEYVIVTFHSSFENKKSAVETVTPMKDELGIWRVSGYYIR
jgi:hypothetical protein